MGNYKDNRANIILSPHNLREYLARPVTKTKQARDRALLITLYLTGARGIEVQKLTKADFEPAEPGFIKIRLYTAKLGRANQKGFLIRERTLVLSSPFLPELLAYKDNLTTPESKLFPISTRRMEQIVYGATEDTICPYTFRHSRLYNLAKDGAGVGELMGFKGATNINSISPYLRGKPMEPRRLD